MDRRERRHRDTEDEATEVHADTGTAAGVGGVTGAAIGTAAGPLGAVVGAVGGMAVGALAERAMHADDDAEDTADEEPETIGERHTTRERQTLVPGEAAITDVPIITPDMARDPDRLKRR